MKANACYLSARPFGLIRHRHSSKQFCSKKCSYEWRIQAGPNLIISTSDREVTQPAIFMSVFLTLSGDEQTLPRQGKTNAPDPSLPFCMSIFGGAQDKILPVHKAAPTRDGATRAFGVP
jgi:hypothetical protein